jgi:hypothetical protein
MTAIREVVDLPEAPVYLHPLDLPAARRLWRRAWLVESSVPFLSLATAVALLFGTSALALFTVPFLVFGIGAVAALLLRREAWAFIPERRKLGERLPVPLSWSLSRAILFAGAIGAVAALQARYLYDHSPATDAMSALAGSYTGVTLFATVGVGALIGGVLIRRINVRRMLLACPALLAISSASLYAIHLDTPAHPQVSNDFRNLTVLVLGVIYLLMRLTRFLISRTVHPSAGSAR